MAMINKQLIIKHKAKRKERKQRFLLKKEQEHFVNSKIVATFASANERKHACKAETLDMRMARSSIG